MKPMLACLALLSVLPAFAQPTAPYNPDADGNGVISASDLLPFLGAFGMPFEPETINCPFTCGDSILLAGQYYGTVPLANLCWFTDNLRSQTYLNGDTIQDNPNHSEWPTTTSGLRTVYGAGDTPCLNVPPDFDACDEEESLATYGRLYNAYVVIDERGVCPEGWRVPSNDDFQVVVDFYSPDEGIGDALKSTSGWSTDDPVFGPGTNGTNLLGFNGLAGGCLGSQDPSFYYAGLTGHWWTSTVSESNSNAFVVRRLEHNHQNTMGDLAYGMHNGFSIRCVKGLE